MICVVWRQTGAVIFNLSNIVFISSLSHVYATAGRGVANVKWCVFYVGGHTEDGEHEDRRRRLGLSECWEETCIKRAG